MIMPEEKAKRTEIGSLGEFGLIDRLSKPFYVRQPSTVKGIGDDAAVIDSGEYYTIISTDLLIEGIHFDLMYHPLKHLGYKAVIVNLSDIYAMNAQPTQITVSIGISNRFSVEAVEELYAGIKSACDVYGVDLVGGDTSSSNKGLIISVTAIGQVTRELITYRNSAKVGDLLCVTGDLGAAFLGLQILEREKQIYLSSPGVKPDLEEQEYLIRKQLKPEARKEMIAIFAKADLIPTSMIDVSDGLASDLFHICRSSGVGATVEEANVPMHNDAKLMALKFKLDPITCALNGGEDYELLFTVSPGDLEKIRFLPDIYIMGEIVPKEDGISLHTTGGNIHPLQAQGWQHFKDSGQEEI
jgi:thiamine-monophosphate kinase